MADESNLATALAPSDDVQEAQSDVGNTQQEDQQVQAPDATAAPAQAAPQQASTDAPQVPASDSNLSKAVQPAPPATPLPTDNPRTQRVAGGLLHAITSSFHDSWVAQTDRLNRMKEAKVQQAEGQAKFASAQAAHETAMAAMADKQYQHWDEEYQRDSTTKDLANMKQAEEMGYAPVATTSMDQGTTANTQSANNSMTQVASNNGGTVPSGLMHFHLGDKVVTMQLQDAAAALPNINDTRKAQGFTPIDRGTFMTMAPKDRQDMARDTLNFNWATNGSGQVDASSAAVMEGRLNLVKAQPEFEGKAALVATLQKNFDLQNSLVQHEAQRKGAATGAEALAAAPGQGAAEGAKAVAAQPGQTKAKVAEINATAGPEARAAGLKAGAEAKAKAEFDDKPVVAYDPNYDNGDGTKGANRVMTHGQANTAGLSNYKADPSTINTVVAGFNDVQRKLNNLHDVATDPNRMKNVQPAIAAAMLKHDKGIEVGAFGTHLDMSQVNAKLYQEDVAAANQDTRDFVAAYANAHEAMTQLPRLQTFGKSNRMTQQQMEAAQNLIPVPGDDANLSETKLHQLNSTITPLRKQVPIMPGAELVPGYEDKNYQPEPRFTPKSAPNTDIYGIKGAFAHRPLEAPLKNYNPITKRLE